MIYLHQVKVSAVRSQMGSRVLNSLVGGDV